MGGEPGGTLWDKGNYAVGVEYGYSLPVARRLNIDFTIGEMCIRDRHIPVAILEEQQHNQGDKKP